MNEPNRTPEVPRRFDAAPPRVTILGLAWLVAVAALCNGAALINVRRFVAAGRTTEEVARFGASLLGAANAAALAAALFVYCVPRLGRGTKPGWSRQAAYRILGYLISVLLVISVPQITTDELDAFKEAVRGYTVWAGGAGVLLFTGWGITSAVRSIRRGGTEKS